MNGCSRARAFAPASTANLSVGFDILGHSLTGMGDRVTAVRSPVPGVRISIPGRDDIPVDPLRNTASIGVVAMVEDLRPGFGIELELEKGIPLGSGVGGSAASAVAGVLAASALLDDPIGTDALLRYALRGEAAASGGVHADNVAPALLGGLVLIRSVEGADIVRLPVPASLRCVLALPDLRVDTRDARALLPPAFARDRVIEQSANLGGFVAALFIGDLPLIGRSMRDVLVEQHRAPLIPGFASVQAAALKAGALGCSISGAGPAVFAWCDGDERAEAATAAMHRAFGEAGVASVCWVSRVDAPGARLEDWE